MTQWPRVQALPGACRHEVTAGGWRLLPVSVVDVAQQVRELQLALCIAYGLEVPQLLEGLHIPVSDLQASR